MTRVLRRALIGLCGLVFACSPVWAGIEYTLTNLGGNSWRYDFTVMNAPAAPAFDEFTVYFDSTSYSGLMLQSSSPGWDSLVIQPDMGIPADGYFDSLRTAGPMPAGTNALGFAFTFTYFAGAQPGTQRFELIDSSGFTVVYSGTTLPAVPEPQTVLLGTVGLAALGLARYFARANLPRA